MTDIEFAAKLRAESHIDELAQASKSNKSPAPDTKNHLFAKDGFDYRVAYFEDGDGQYYRVVMSVGKSGSVNTVYNIGKMQKNKADFSNVAQRPNGYAVKIEKSTNPTISQHPSGVNTHYMQNNKKDTQNSISGGSSELVPQGLKIEKLNEKYGTIERGEKPVREVSLPKRTAKDQYVSKYARTMAEAGVTNEPTVDLIKKDLAAGRLSHEVITDKKAMENAENIIREDGFKGALKTWTDVIDGKSKPTKYTLALGQTLYNEAVENKDAALVKKMIADMVLQFSEAGQNLQAARLLKRLTPDGRLYALEKSVVKI
ncbi:MAG: hypothetical protein RR424_11140, partial [Oscillospiraceae bacterium]